MRRNHTASLTLAHELARPTFGVVSRHLLRTHGIDRHKLRRFTANGDLEPIGTHAIRVMAAQWDPTRSPVSAAVMNAGSAAWAEGLAALIITGLTGHTLDRIDVGVHENSASRQADGIVRHRLRMPPPLRSSPLLHAHPAYAALRAASWCETEHEAARLLTSVIRQKLSCVDRLKAALELVPTLPRRAFVLAVLHDLDRENPSLYDLDLLRIVRRHGLPHPDLVEYNRDRDGRLALEARWKCAHLTVRIEDSSGEKQHRDTSQRLAHDKTIACPDDRIFPVPASALLGAQKEFSQHLRSMLNESPDRRVP